MFDKRKYRETYRKQHAEQLREKAKAYYEEHRERRNDEAVKERNRENARRYRARDPVRLRERSQRYREKHPPYPEYQKAYYQEHSERLCAWGKAYREEHADVIAARDRISRLKRIYGITQEDYDKLFIEQGGKCAICATDKPGQARRHFHLDHCHETGAIRGLLCYRCNWGLVKQERLAAALHLDLDNN